MDSDEEGSSLGAALAARKSGLGGSKGMKQSASSFFASGGKSSKSSGLLPQKRRRTDEQDGSVKRGSSWPEEASDDEDDEDEEEGDEDASSEEEEEDFEEEDDDGSSKDGSLTGKKRKRNAPEELSSHKRVSRFQRVVHVPKVKRRDPRFESGPVNEDGFQKAYAFLADYKDSEIAELKKEMRKVKDVDERKKMQVLVTKLQQQRAQERVNEATTKVLRERKKSEREAVASGTKPFYLTQREVKELARIETCKALEKKGDRAIDKALAKRRKKLANKERRLLPAPFAGRRTAADGGNTR
jgi:ribosomal RNA-processing protein 36